MKNSIHNFYLQKHAKDPQVCFEECFSKTTFFPGISRKLFIVSALAASLLLGVVLLPVLQQGREGGAMDASMGTGVDQGSLAAAQGAGVNAGENTTQREAPSRDSSGGESDRLEMLPITTIAPKYPPEALAQEITGWALLTFTVTAEGEVENPVVTDAEPAEIFNEPALTAVRQFRFNPRVVNGAAVAVDGVQYLFRFNL